MFFKEHNVRIGISYDGPFNDEYRGLTRAVCNSIKLLNDFDVVFGIISVLPDKSLSNIEMLYDFYKRICHTRTSLKFSPMIQSLASTVNNLAVKDYAEYFTKYCQLMDLWVFDKNVDFDISSFSDYFKARFHSKNKVCTMNSCMYRFISIDSRSKIFPCGRYYPEDYCLGNITQIKTINDVFESEKYNAIVEKSIKRRNVCIESCDYYPYCEGGCNNDAINGGGIEVVNYFECLLKKFVFKHINDMLSKTDFIFNCNSFIVKIIDDSNSNSRILRNHLF